MMCVSVPLCVLAGMYVFVWACLHGTGIAYLCVHTHVCMPMDACAYLFVCVHACVCMIVLFIFWRREMDGRYLAF